MNEVCYGKQDLDVNPLIITVLNSADTKTHWTLGTQTEHCACALLGSDP